MAKTYDEDAPVSDEVATAIGHMVVQWGHLEDNAIILTAVLLGANHYDFRSVGVNLPTTAKLDALGAVAEQVLRRKKAAKIVEIITAAKKLTAERNRIVHGSWYPTKRPNVAKRYTYSARDGLKQHLETVSAKRVHGYTARVTALQRRLNKHLRRLGFFERRS